MIYLSSTTYIIYVLFDKMSLFSYKLKQQSCLKLSVFKECMFWYVKHFQKII